MGLLFGVGTTRPTYAYDYYYGIEWDVTTSNPAVTRIGKMELHQLLPLQSMMRRCILKDDGTVNYYLHPNDSTKRDNGAAANLDGTDGQVMVEIPDMYIRFEIDGNKRRCMMSDHALPGFIKWNKQYVSAYEATVERTTNKLASVMNLTPEFRGGNNNAGWDEQSNTLLGKPASSINLYNFRAYARNRGSVSWNCYTYQVHKMLWWLYAVEYANFNSQADFNAGLTESGYRQGGLSAGITTLNSGMWSKFNGYFSVIPCGTTNPLGNNSGIIPYEMPAEYSTTPFTVNVPSYRGVENPFGDIWKWTDGAKLMVQSDANGGLSKLYTCGNPANFVNAGVDNYTYRGNLSRRSGYMKEMVLGEYGEIMPLSVGAGSTTYFCDNYWLDNSNAERGVLFGGRARDGAYAGVVCADACLSPSWAAADIGSRLCFMQIETNS